MSNELNLGNAFALLIGVGGKNFDATVKDADAIHKVLTDPSRAAYPPGNVRLLTEAAATKQNVVAAFDDIIQKTSGMTDATVFIYYSGHGGRYRTNDPADKDGFKYYLKTHGYKEDDLENTMLSGEIFSQKTAAITAVKLIILLDCCHAGGIKESVHEMVIKSTEAEKAELSGVELIKQLQGGKGRVFISSCDSNEKSVIMPGSDNSLFTEVVLEALDGAASGKSPFVKVIDLMYHVLNNVASRITDRGFRHAQNPVINEVTGLNASYMLCANGNARIIPKSAEMETLDLKSDIRKLQEIEAYPRVIKQEIHYNQSVNNTGAQIGKQVTIQNSTGDINL